MFTFSSGWRSWPDGRGEKRSAIAIPGTVPLAGAPCNFCGVAKYAAVIPAERSESRNPLAALSSSPARSSSSTVHAAEPVLCASFPSTRTQVPAVLLNGFRVCARLARLPGMTNAAPRCRLPARSAIFAMSPAYAAVTPAERSESRNPLAATSSSPARSSPCTVRVTNVCANPGPGRTALWVQIYPRLARLPGMTNTAQTRL